MKKSMKHLLAALVLSVSVPAWAESGVVVVLHDGTEVGFAFDRTPVVKTDTAATLLVETADGLSVGYDYDAIRKIYLGDVSATGIGALSQATVRPVFRPTSGGIEICGMKDGERVEAFAPDGSLVGSAVANGGQAALRLPGTPAAVYIIRTSGGITFKFINK